MGRGEIYVQLFVDYAEDEKLAAVSRTARLLYVDGLCKAKRLLSDGVLTKLQVEKLLYPDRPTIAEKAAAELVATGAWSWDGRRNAYVIAAWAKRNKTRAQVKKAREAAEERSARGNHQRWHEARRVVDADCRFCSEVDPQPDPSEDPYGDPYEDPGRESTETETETETEIRKIKPSSSPPPAATDADPDFERFWSHYPRKRGKVHARKAWTAALKKGVSPEAIVEGAERYAGERKGEDEKFTAHPATWINGQRWDDSPFDPRRHADGPAPFWEN